MRPHAMTTEARKALADEIEAFLATGGLWIGFQQEKWAIIVDALRSTPEALSVDEVARAQYEAYHSTFGCGIPTWRSLRPDQQMAWRHMARAVCALAQAPASHLSAKTEEGDR